MTVVGARPQFIKAAAVSRIMRKKIEEILVHTGQHYDSNMSQVFFEELNIPKPNYYLGVGSGSHAKQTAEMLIKIEEILVYEKPDYLMVYGDTNSTLAGALAASKILVPIIHVEAGLRSFNLSMPEEQNRILTDHLSKYLFCPTDTAVANLYKEGITNQVYNVGDVMCDAVLYYSKRLEEKTKDYFFNRLVGLFQNIEVLDKWYLATIHRAESTSTINKVEEILKAFEQFHEKVIFPVHPRTKPMVKELYQRNHYQNILFVEPVGYLDMIYFTKHALKVITDSGGLQKEAYILNTDSITVREQTEWIETLKGNHNILCKPECEDILDKVYHTIIDEEDREKCYGNGNTAQKICDIINKKEG